MNTVFVPLEIVNGNGNPWQPRAAPKERRVEPIRKKFHRGWLVYGWTKAQLEALDVAREKLREAQKKEHKPVSPKFCPESHMRANRGSKLTPKHLVTYEAALKFANIAANSGFFGVTTFEDKRDA